jgi:hypothetical protein
MLMFDALRAALVRGLVGFTLAGVLVAGMPGLAAGKPKSTAHRLARCAVPTGWSLVGRDAQAIVITRSRSGVGQWSYCVLATGSTRPLVASVDNPYTVGDIGPPDRVFSVLLAGRYAAFGAMWDGHDQDIYVTINVRDLLAAHRASEMIDAVYNNDVCWAANPDGFGPNPAGFLLSPTGVAAWHLATCSSGFGQSPDELIQALDARTGWRATLDAASSGGLSAVQLFQCAAGCAPGTTMAIWMHDGVPRIARVG